MSGIIEYLTWHDLTKPYGIYGFINEMQCMGVSIDDFPEIKIYYEMLIKKANKTDMFDDEYFMYTVDYLVNKIRCALVRYKIAHTLKEVKKGYYYFWYDKEG
jgi:hypothetical protein